PAEPLRRGPREARRALPSARGNRSPPAGPARRQPGDRRPAEPGRGGGPAGAGRGRVAGQRPGPRPRGRGIGFPADRQRPPVAGPAHGPARPPDGDPVTRRPPAPRFAAVAALLALLAVLAACGGSSKGRASGGLANVPKGGEAVDSAVSPE